MRIADLSKAKRLVPDLLHLARSLARDPELPRSVRWSLALLLGYLAMPFDLIPDFIPVLGYADDVLVVALVFRFIAARIGQDALTRHWRGSPEGLDLVRRLCGMR